MPMCSGLIPSTVGAVAASPAGTGTVAPETSTVIAPAFGCAALTLRKFIFGEPMKPATKRLTGRL